MCVYFAHAICVAYERAAYGRNVGAICGRHMLCHIFPKIINIVLLSNIRKVTTEAGVASIKGAHDARLEYGEPVEEGGRDEALHHDDQHLGAGDLVLGQPARPAGHLLAALLPSYQGSDEVNDPVQYEACGVMCIF